MSRRATGREVPGAPGPMIEARGLAFAYTGKPVLEGLSFTVARGSFLGIIGPNGAGKSTLLKLLAGLLLPREGEIFIQGRDLKSFNHKELARQISVVAQGASIEFPYRVIDVVLLGRLPHQTGMSLAGEEDLAAAHQALEATGTLHLAERPIHELSGGERQRVFVSQALAQDTGIMLLDEPATFLDVRYRTALYDLFKGKTRREGLTIVAVMHDLNLAAQYCEHILLLSDGKLEVHGRTEDVLTAAHLRDIYEVEIAQGVDARTGVSYLLPLGKEMNRKSEARTSKGANADISAAGKK